MREVFLAFLCGVFLYLPFSRYELWLFIFPALALLLYYTSQRFYFISGAVFFFFSLRCVNIASIEYGGINPFLAYLIFSAFVLFLTAYQFSLPLYLWKKFSKNRLYLLPLFYTFFEVLRSYFPYGGFPWLVVGEVLLYVPVLKHSLTFISVYGASLFIWYVTYFAIKRRLLAFSLLLVFVALLGLYSFWEVQNKIKTAKSIKVALVQTAVPQQDKLSDQAFRKHTNDILSLVEEATKSKSDLIVLPESALAFLFSEEEDMGRQRLFELSYQAPILVGLIDIREGLKPYNSAYLIKDGQMVGYYDKVRLLPVGEYLPYPFEFLKNIFGAIAGLDYVPGEKKEPIRFKDLSIATPICFEVAYWDLVKKLSKDANLIAVLTNDGWFNDSDCTHQHFTWARVRAIENGKFVLWVNNSGDTAIIDPFGRVLKREPYMKRSILIGDVKLIP